MPSTPAFPSVPDYVVVDSFKTSTNTWRDAFQSAISTGLHVRCTKAEGVSVNLNRTYILTIDENSTIVATAPNQIIDLRGVTLDCSTSSGTIFRLEGARSQLLGGQFIGEFVETKRKLCAIDVRGEASVVSFVEIRKFLGGGVVLRKGANGCRIFQNRMVGVAFAPSSSEGSDYGAIHVGEALRNCVVSQNELIDCLYSGVSVGSYGRGHIISENRVVCLKSLPPGQAPGSGKGRSTGIYCLGPQQELMIVGNTIYNPIAEGINVGSMTGVTNYVATFSAGSTTLDVSGVTGSSPVLVAGDRIFGVGIAAGAQVLSTMSGATDHTLVTISAPTLASGTSAAIRVYAGLSANISGATLSVNSVSTPNLAAGDEVFQVLVAPGTLIASGSPTGGVGIYGITRPQNVAASTQFWTDRSGAQNTVSVIVANNIVKEAYAAGIAFYGGKDFSLRRIRCVGNEVTAGGARGDSKDPANITTPLTGGLNGIYVDGVEDSVVEGNVVGGGLGRGIALVDNYGNGNRRLVISSNKIDSTTDIGLIIKGESHLVTGNLLTSVTGKGMLISNANSCAVHGNHVTSDNSSAVLMEMVATDKLYECVNSLLRAGVFVDPTYTGSNLSTKKCCQCS